MSDSSRRPPVLASMDDFRHAAQIVSDSAGLVYTDVERASSYRYGDRAFLLQLLVSGHGAMLVDPEANGQDIGPLAAALSESGICLHACRSDLPSLAALGVIPGQLHDTEIAAKVLSTTGFSLGKLVESYIGVHLPKQYARADWSRRPLPDKWLEYALDDVRYLPELLEMLLEDTATVPVELPAYYPRRLRGENRALWYRELMSQMVTWQPPTPPAEPWRRLSHLTSLRSPRELARARALWQVREDIAARDDIAVHRLVTDSQIVDAARRAPATKRQLAAMPGFSGDFGDRLLPQAFAALRAADSLPTEQLPARRPPAAGGTRRPSHRQWKHKAPHANALLGAARELLTELSEVAQVESQTLLPSAELREWVWAAAHAEAREHRGLGDSELIEAALTEAGSLPWQIRLATPALQRALEVLR